MATECTAYRDSKGSLHATPERATLADLANVLGRVGEEGGMTAGVAKLILEKRDEIEQVFAEHDVMLSGLGEVEDGASDVVPIKGKNWGLDQSEEGWRAARYGA